MSRKVLFELLMILTHMAHPPTIRAHRAIGQVALTFYSSITATHDGLTKVVETMIDMPAGDFEPQYGILIIVLVVLLFIGAAEMVVRRGCGHVWVVLVDGEKGVVSVHDRVLFRADCG